MLWFQLLVLSVSVACNALKAGLEGSCTSALQLCAVEAWQEENVVIRWSFNTACLLAN